MKRTSFAGDRLTPCDVAAFDRCMAIGPDGIQDRIQGNDRPRPDPIAPDPIFRSDRKMSAGKIKGLAEPGDRPQPHPLDP